MLSGIIRFFIIVTLIFIISHSLIRLIPGDPIAAILEESGLVIDTETLRAKLGLDRSLWVQLPETAIAYAKGEFGTSIIGNKSVSSLIFPSFLISVKLGLLTFLVAVFISFSIGLAAAFEIGNKKKRGFFSTICSVWAGSTAATSIAWIGPIFLYLFSVKSSVFPITGSFLLASISLGILYSGFWAKLIRNQTAFSLLSQSAMGARARGSGELRILLKYGFWPASGPVFGYIFTQFGRIIAGTFLCEIIFNLPGLGTLTTEAVLSRDFPVIQAGIFFTSILALIGNILGDMIRTMIDPRGAAV